MKILLLSYEYPAETGFGGIGTYTWYHARALVKLGHQVHVLAGAVEPTSMRTSEHDGVVVFRYALRGSVMAGLWQFLGRYGMWWTRNRLENAFSMYRGVQLLRRHHRYDIVEMPECGAEGMLLNNLTRTPTLVRFHSPARLIMPFYDVRQADVALCSRAEERGIAGANWFSSCSRFLADQVREHIKPHKPIRVIPNGIDLSLFDREEPAGFRERHGLPANRTIIFFAGRMEPRKGVHLLKDIMARVLEHHEVAFVVAGQDLFGHVERELEPALASRRLRGSFHYVGKLDLAQVRAGVRESDIFLLPSLWENCPYSCLEAMAAGKAIVSTDQGGMPELIQSGNNGLLSRNGDTDSYVQALERLILDDALRARLGRAARGTVEQRLTDVHTAQAAVQYYAECLERRDRAA